LARRPLKQSTNNKLMPFVT